MLPGTRRHVAHTASAANGASLEVRGLTGGWTRAPVLHNVTLTVRPGEIVALFGANGAGKTTLLRGLSGTLPSCRGDVLLDGADISGASPWRRVRRGMAHIPEGRHLFPSMTVAENLQTGALAGTRGSLEDAYELFPRLRERQDQLAGTLSGGEQQMVAIARALMTSPRLLLIDEMSAGLAPVITERLVEGLATIRGRGVSILLVEQAPHMVARVIDRAYLLRHGATVGEGTLDQLGGVDALAELYLGVH